MYFIDAAHFIHAVYLGFLWCFLRISVRANSGRKRWNVLGALNAMTREIETITNESYITSEEVCQLLRKIAAKHPDELITWVLDNARYQRCAKVMECAAEVGIELLFLPPYSPNLNLIERVWGFVKDTALYSKHYATFAEFKQAITDCLNESTGRHASKLKTLLTLRFHRLENGTL